MKEKSGKRVIKNTVIFFILIYSIELIVRISAKNNIIDWAMLRIAISSFLLAIIIALITSFGSRLWYQISSTIIATVIAFYSWLQINLYHYLGFFMGAGNAEQGTKTLDYVKEYIGSSKPITYIIFIILIVFLVYIWWIKKVLRLRYLNKTTFYKFNLESRTNKILTLLYTVLIMFVLSISYYFTLKVEFMQNELQSVKNIDLIKFSVNSNLSVSQFGVLVYCTSDLNAQLFSFSSNDDSDYIDNNDEESLVINDNSRIIDDSAWQYVIDNEDNKPFNNLNNYFINRNITEKNKNTGIFEGKNLIVILMESVNMIAINETEFPTIYKIYNEGISFTNNYTPRNNCSTGNNEMTVMTSLFTINNTCTFNTYKKNRYFQAIFNMFDGIDYKTSSYHNYGEQYYARRTAHPNMGSMKYYNVNDLGISWNPKYEEWPSDVDLIKTATPNFINQEKFMVFMSSVTTHQPYTVSSEYGDAHLSNFKNYKYNTSVKRYMSKMKELDAALELLLKELKLAGKLDDTVIALFADHYPYGLTTNSIASVLGDDVKTNKEIDRTPMVIYNSKTEGQKITKYTTIIDLLPTLLNMFNLNYDPRFYFGHDVFSDYHGRAIFADGSWQDDVGYYSATSGKFITKVTNITYTNEEIIEINNDISTKQKMSALAIQKNYFNYLYLRIAAYEEEIRNSTINCSE